MTANELRSQRLIISGIIQVLLGCILGFLGGVVRHYNSLRVAHIEYTANGVLSIALAFAVTKMNLPPILLTVFEVCVHVGTWFNGGPFIISAFTGAGTPLAPLAQPDMDLTSLYSKIVTGMLQICAVTIVTALMLGIVGAIRYLSIIKKAESKIK